MNRYHWVEHEDILGNIRCRIMRRDEDDEEGSVHNTVLAHTELQRDADLIVQALNRYADSEEPAP